MAKPLTPAETRVFRTYCEAETHEVAARDLGISTQTLKNHLGSIYKKMDRRKAHSALYALIKQSGFDPFETSLPNDGLPTGLEMESGGSTGTARSNVFLARDEPVTHQPLVEDQPEGIDPDPDHVVGSLIDP